MAQKKNGVSNASPKKMTAVEMKEWYEKNKAQLGQFANFASAQEAFYFIYYSWRKNYVFV